MDSSRSGHSRTDHRFRRALDTGFSAWSPGYRGVFTTICCPLEDRWPDPRAGQASVDDDVKLPLAPPEFGAVAGAPSTSNRNASGTPRVQSSRPHAISITCRPASWDQHAPGCGASEASRSRRLPTAAAWFTRWIIDFNVALPVGSAGAHGPRMQQADRGRLSIGQVSRLASAAISGHGRTSVRG